MNLKERLQKLFGKRKQYLVYFESLAHDNELDLHASMVVTLKGLTPSKTLFESMILEQHNFKKVEVKSWIEVDELEDME